MSTFENNYDVYLMSRTSSMPAWAKAERHEYCEPAFTRNISAKANKRKSVRRAMFLSVIR